MNSAFLNALSDQVLAVLRARPSRWFTLAELSTRLGCLKSDILFAVDILRQAGYKVESDRQGRYRFLSAPDLLLTSEILHGLKTKVIGRTVYAYQSVQSTNLIGSQLAEAGAPQGSIIVAESQTKGRGRLGRLWHSPEGKGIYFSIILYPDLDPATAPGLSIMTAVSLAETIALYVSKKVTIKWPNDCLLNGRKVAGILTELSADVGKTRHVVVGIGINVNHTRRDFPADITKTATSLRAEMKKDFPRVKLLQQLLFQFEKDYLRFQKGGLAALRERILKYSHVIGKQVRLDMSGERIAGKALDIDDHGNLVLKTADGIRRFNAGEVTVVK